MCDRARQCVSLAFTFALSFRECRLPNDLKHAPTVNYLYCFSSYTSCPQSMKSEVLPVSL